MSAHIEKLKKSWQDAEAKSVKLQNEKDEAIQKVRDRYRDRQRDALDEAAEAQKRYCDAEAVQSLLDRYEGEELQNRADALGLKLPDARD